MKQLATETSLKGRENSHYVVRASGAQSVYQVAVLCRGECASTEQLES